MFTLLYGDKIGRAPGKKIVPAEAFSKALDGEGVLQKIKEDAARYREETALEVEQLKEVAQREGFEHGLAEWGAKIQALEAQIASVEAEVKKMLVPVALGAAKKIVGRELETSEETVADIVATHLRAVTQHQRVAIFCNRANLDTLEKHRQRLKGMFERLESLTIQEREDIEEGACVIETEAGIINAHWNQVWRILEEALQEILA